MPCLTTLIVEYDEDNRKVDWHLNCDGDCPGHKKCKPVRNGPENLSGGGERYTHECACKRGGSEESGDDCKLVVFEDITKVKGKTRTKFKGKCIGRCATTQTRCRPLVIKEYKVAGEDSNEDFNLDDTSIHTIRHYKCVCPDKLV